MTLTNNIAIMQPYLFPYVGYMNLVQATDRFVFYDDVNFRKKGWINRNEVILNNSKYMFSLPLKQISQNKTINESLISDLPSFKKKFIKQLKISYKNAQFLSPTLQYVDDVLNTKYCSISTIASRSIILFFDYVKIKKEFCYSSDLFPSTKDIGRTDRIIYIAKKFGCKNYINVAGGRALYSPQFFYNAGITLKFLTPRICSYSQINASFFVEKLSIIDLMMNLHPNDIRYHLDSYTVEP